MDDLLLHKANEFTATEVVTIEAWEDAANAGNYGLAHDILHAGLLAEHYRSLLSEDPAQITDAQSAQQADLLAKLDELLHQLAAATGKTYLR